MKTKTRIILEALLKIFQSSEDSKDPKSRKIAKRATAILTAILIGLSFYQTCEGPTVKEPAQVEAQKVKDAGQ